MIFRITDQCLHTDLTLLVALKLQSTTRRQTLYRFLVTDFLISSSLLYLVIFLKLVNELSVISQTGCKDTDFFLSSKFFCNIFSKKTTNRVFHLPEIGFFLLRISERASSSVKRLSDLRRDIERQKRLKNKKNDRSANQHTDLSQ